MPTFSVIIPTYNRAGLIEKTIRSVLSQTEHDFEVIVVDDGGTDNTEAVVSRIDDDRVRYHRKDNEERAAARNAGTSLASGRYVTFLDSDDVLYPDHLKVAREMVDKYDQPEWFHLGYELRGDDDDSVRRIDYLPEIANDDLTDGNFLSCRGVFVRRDIALQHPFNPDRKLSGTEDYELWLRLASRYPLYCDRSITSAIIQHDARSVVNTNREDLFTRIELLEKYLGEDSNFMEKYGAKMGEFKANNRIYIALHLVLARMHRAQALGLLVKSVGLSPKALRNKAFYGTIKRLLFPL